MGRISWSWIVAALVALAVPSSAAAMYLQTGGRYPVPENATQVTLADLNGDGTADIVTVAGQGDSSEPSVASVLLGNGDGSFAARVDTQLLAGTPDFSPRALATGDVTGDGRPEVVVAGTVSGNAEVSVLSNQGGALSAGTGYAVSGASDAAGLAVGDLNGDGSADVVVTSSTGSAYVMLAQAGGGLGSATEYTVSGTSWGLLTGPVTLADVNHDGRLDLLASGYNQADHSLSLSVRLGNGDGTFGVANLFPLGPNGDDAVGLAVGDVNGDGHPDVAVSYAELGAAVLSGNGDGSFGTPQSILTGDGGDGIALADADGDGHLDAVLDASDNGYVLAVPGTGDGTFGAPVDSPFVSGSVDRLAVGDVNGDGIADAVTLAGDYGGLTGTVAQVISTAAAPPAATTGAYSAVTSSSATLNGTVNPHGQPTTYWFEWGTSTAYGSSTPHGSLPAGVDDVPVSAPLSGLPTGTVFHFRLVAEHGSGPAVYGADNVFGTPATTPPDTPTTGTPTSGTTPTGTPTSGTPTTGSPTTPTPAPPPTLRSPRLLLLGSTSDQRHVEVKVGCAQKCTLAATELDVIASTTPSTVHNRIAPSHSFQDEYALAGPRATIVPGHVGTLKLAIPLDAQTSILGTLAHHGTVELIVRLGSGAFSNVGRAEAYLYQRAHPAKKPKKTKKTKQHKTTTKSVHAAVGHAAAGPQVYPVDPPIDLNNGWDRRGVRYTAQVHGSQVTTWKLNRENIDTDGCVSYSRGSGTQVITFNSRRALGVVAPMALRGDEVLTQLDGSMPLDMLTSFSIDRSGSVHSGVEGTCRAVASGSPGSGQPQDDCGHREQSGNTALDLNTGTATMWRDLWDDNHVGAQTYQRCPFYGAFVPAGGANDLRLLSVHHSGVPKILVRHPPKVVTFTASQREVTHPQGADVVTEVTWKVTLTRAR